MSNQLQISGAAKIRSIQGPVVANSGVISALDGDASQYVRGDGTLADFPTSTGGGSSVSYYLNTSVSQGTIGGVAYKQLSKVPIAGAGTDVTISANGYIASYLTDANDPALLEVPAGNFNCEFYFSVNSNAHNPYVYAEVYKYDGTTFTLLGSSQSVPEYLTNGTTLSPYYFAIPVATSVLTITDRISIRIYVNVDGRTVTLHTENNHLCQVVTTFSKGLTTLNSLTRQVQFFQTGTSGTDFAISSSVATHTFNLPVASASNTGKLSSTDWSTFNGKIPYTGATANVDLGIYNLTAAGVTANSFNAIGSGVQGGYLYLKKGSSPFNVLVGSNSITAEDSKFILMSDAGSSNYKLANIDIGLLTNNTARTYTLPDASGTLALLESTQTFTGTNTFSGSIIADGSVLLKNNVTSYLAGYVNLGGIVTGYGFSVGLPNGGSPLINQLIFNSAAAYNYTFPAASGTIALTSNLSSYVPYTGATANVDLGLNNLTANNVFGETSLNVKVLPSGSVYSTGYATLSSLAGKFTMAQEATASNLKAFTFDFSAWASNSSYTYTLPAANGTIALTSNLSSYVPYTGATTALNMGNNSITTSNFFYGKGIELDAGVEEVGGTVIFRQRTGISGGGANYTTIGAVNNNVLSFNFWQDSPSGFNRYKIFQFRTDNITISTSRIYQMPDASGTLALGTGTTNYVSKWTGTNTIGNSLIFDNGTSVGIGTSSPVANLDLGASGANNIILRNTSNAYNLGYIGNAGGKINIGFSNSNSSLDPLPYLTVTSGGNVGIGTGSSVSAYGFFGVAGNVTISSLTGVVAGFSDAVNGTTRLYVQSGVNGINVDQAFAISTGGGVPVERMRITSGGFTKMSNTGTYLNVASTYHELRNSTNDDWAVVISQTSSPSPYGLLIKYSGASPNNASNNFLTCSDSTQDKLNIYSNGNVVNRNGSYGTLSDIKLKENIVDATPKLQDILKLKVRNFNLINDENKIKQLGFIAQEFEEVFPLMIEESPDKDEDNNDLSSVTKSIKTSVLVPMLVKAIQEQQALITSLQARLDNAGL
jgi:hypothetical protein